ncbi:uncharacterized protein DNG_02247 [Cephalotrichum gorgonifer]|uniref:Secreted protein n=1 Tax=Cephalotrichum gorgonifer TaxID=2041049 RepID=A0AAE8SSX2_9PEZI|nr:uncharacterized protein DNG_02247 [Cephalotrichum gorgonifer]
MHFSSLLAAGLSATITTALAVSPRAPAVPRILKVDFTGNGCTANTPKVSGSASRLTLSLGDFGSHIGYEGDRPLSVGSCNAQITIDDGVPGWALAVKKVSVEGSLFGAGSGNLTLSSLAFWQHSPDITFSNTARVSSTNTRPTVQNVNLEVGPENLGRTEPGSDGNGVVTPIDGPFASECVAEGGNVGLLVINLTASLRGSGIYAFTGKGDAPVTEYVELEWIPCDNLPVDIEIPDPAAEEPVREDPPTDGGAE